MMNNLLYSPDATCWNLRGPEVHVDKDNTIIMPVRQYTHRSVHYTILACVDVTDPRCIFYKLEVKRPIGVSFPTNPDEDFKVVKALLTWAPITTEQYRTAEQRVLLKLANKQREDYFKNMDVNEHTENSTDIPDGKSRNKHKRRNAKHEKSTERASLTGKPPNSKEEVKDVGDNKSRRDINKHTVTSSQQFKKLSGPGKDTFVNTTVNATAQCLVEHYGHGVRLSHIKRIVMGYRNAIAGLYVEQCHQIRKLVKSIDCLIHVHTTFPAQITQPHVCTGVVVADEPNDTIRTKGWLQLNNVKDEPTCRTKIIAGKDDTSDDTIGSGMVIAMTPDTLTMAVYQPEPLQVDVTVCKDDMKKRFDDDDAVEDDEDEDAVEDDDDDDDCFGVLSVFCRSSLHGDYSGGGEDREKFVG